MQLQLNGEPIQMADGSTIADLIREKSLDPAFVVVEHNLMITVPEQWPQTSLKEGDTLEILRFVGGG